MRKDNLAKRASLLVTVALIAGGLVAASTITPVHAEVVNFARGYAYGAAENAVTDPNLAIAPAEAFVPNPPDQTQSRAVAHDEDVFLDVLGMVRVMDTEADACLEEGASAKLQKEANFAHITARGDTPAADDDDVNSGRNDEDPERAEVTPDAPFNNRCVRRGRLGPRPTGVPTNSRTPTSTPGATSGPGATSTPQQGPVTATPSPTPTTARAPQPRQPSPTPTTTGSPGSTPTPAGTATNCEEAVTDPASADFTGPTCLSTLPLWHSRGYARTLLEDIVGLIGPDIEAEAMARCVNGKEEFMTGARFGLVGGLLGGTDRPNTNLDVVIVQGAVVKFWETNWDPKTNTTTDGSETVWVNGLHIYTPTEEIILSHAEATADCQKAPTAGPSAPNTVTVTPPQPQPTTPEGGFPRDISLNASKNAVLYSKIFTLSGAVTPATQFQTPRRCVEGVTLTIRRDPIGGPEEFVDVGTVVTDSEGNFTFNYQADVSSQWLAFIDKDNPTDCALASSNSHSVLVKPFVKLKISQKTPRFGKTIRLRGIVEPCLDHAGTRLKLKRVFQSKLVEIDTKALDASCIADFMVKANFKSAVFQVAWPKQDEDHQTGKSRAKVVRTQGN
ncbi:MAG TPA: hypothetical protein VNC78_08830 [Actinomycetota bacterium]|nr:hypothetical protein [Actinomycetota bacterium]